MESFWRNVMNVALKADGQTDVGVGDAACSGKGFQIQAFEGADSDFLIGGRGVDKGIVAQINAYMVAGIAIGHGIKAENIANFQMSEVSDEGIGIQCANFFSTVGKVNALIGEYMTHKAAAIKLIRAGSVKDIAGVEVF